MFVDAARLFLIGTEAVLITGAVLSSLAWGLYNVPRELWVAQAAGGSFCFVVTTIFHCLRDSKSFYIKTMPGTYAEAVSDKCPHVY